MVLWVMVQYLIFIYMKEINVIHIFLDADLREKENWKVWERADTSCREGAAGLEGKCEWLKSSTYYLFWGQLHIYLYSLIDESI